MLRMKYSELKNLSLSWKTITDSNLVCLVNNMRYNENIRT